MQFHLFEQVESREKPEELPESRPMAVAQYNAWKGGGLIAVNYAARASGVKRGMRGDDARKACPDLILVPVPCVS